LESIVFDDNTNLSLYIEQIKEQQELSSFIEAVVWYHDNETDMEMVDIVKLLNTRILDKIKFEAQDNKLLKEKTKPLTIEL
jgi:hypothetical protein